MTNDCARKILSICLSTLNALLVWQEFCGTDQPAINQHSDTPQQPAPIALQRAGVSNAAVSSPAVAKPAAAAEPGAALPVTEQVLPQVPTCEPDIATCEPDIATCEPDIATCELDMYLCDCLQVESTFEQVVMVLVRNNAALGSQLTS